MTKTSTSTPTGAARPGAIGVRNPCTGREDYWFVPPTEAGLAARCRELRAAQPAWRGMGVEARCAAMLRLADAFDARLGLLVQPLTVDTGRTRVAAGEIASVVRNIRRWCGRAPALVVTEEFDSKVMPSLRIGQQLVPYPLVGVISPWNFPFALSFIDAIPALLAGCAVIVKPSEVTPRFVEPLRQVIDSVPEVARVLGFVQGGGATGAQLIGQVDAICFTGSVATGRKVAVAAAERFIPAFLELGGKDPAIVLPSADLDKASDGILRVSCTASGQVCLALERVYVHESVHDRLVDLLVEKGSRLGLAYPSLDDGPIGPMIFDRQADIIDAQLDDAVAKGATIRCGGKSRNLGGGRYVPATVVTGVDHGMKLMSEETFGPVTPVMPFRTVDEAVALANETVFGLSGAVFAGTLEEARAVAERINAGGMSLNDAGLTRETFEAEKNSFGYSGIGGSRHGDAGLLRFFRKQALFAQRGAPATIG
ncbi:MAG: aldehyde dehydrogenase family protein [Gammaproteobacteria bacterium]|nr:aldehyde dehydrogenase family protein [Gammaproteobacteria bacterium]